MLPIFVFYWILQTFYKVLAKFPQALHQIFMMMFLSTDFTFPQLHTFPKFTFDFSSPDYQNLPGSTCHSFIHRIFI